ncbi:adenosine deaminase [Fodinicola acaciae]|uniref:adenosine deaminase n=1 Tax=Fodinicola acaciae TaxID=2681555 RepID=UPI0013D6F7C9|nr:adenosine deaminase [Fodinicola acaciae]
MRDLRTLPKAHLHIHLESTVRPATLADFGVRTPDPRQRFRDFRDFADFNTRIRESLRTPADFRRIAVEFCADQAADGVRYAEVTFTAASHGERLGDLDMPLAAVLDGLDEGQEACGVECQVILDHSRRRSVERAWRTLELAKRHAERGVVAIGMAGDEAYSLAPFKEIFAAAADTGLHVVHHAGEAGGADSIREALVVGRAERLGHGFRVLEDDELVEDVRERGIALEVCPSSNVGLSLVPSYAEHPLPRLLDADLAVTLNTDIPNVIGDVTLTDEYSRVKDTFGYQDDVLADIACAGVEASFAPEATRKGLYVEIETWLNR